MSLWLEVVFVVTGQVGATVTAGAVGVGGNGAAPAVMAVLPTAGTTGFEAAQPEGDFSTLSLLLQGLLELRGEGTDACCTAEDAEYLVCPALA